MYEASLSSYEKAVQVVTTHLGQNHPLGTRVWVLAREHSFVCETA